MNDLPEELQDAVDHLRAIAEAQLGPADLQVVRDAVETLTAPWRSAQSYVAGVPRRGREGFAVARGVEDAEIHIDQLPGGALVGRPPNLLDLVLMAHDKERP